MAMRLETENVRKIEAEMLSELEMYGSKGADAEALCNYIAGMHEMAQAVIEAIIALGGK